MRNYRFLFNWKIMIHLFDTGNFEILASGYFGGFQPKGMCFILLCVILVLRLIHVLHFGTIQVR